MLVRLWWTCLNLARVKTSSHRPSQTGHFETVNEFYPLSPFCDRNYTSRGKTAACFALGDTETCDKKWDESFAFLDCRKRKIVYSRTRIELIRLDDFDTWRNTCSARIHTFQVHLTRYSQPPSAQNTFGNGWIVKLLLRYFCFWTIKVCQS